jgi:uncharacterized membrane protein YagU involved in acid resistance
MSLAGMFSWSVVYAAAFAIVAAYFVSFHIVKGPLSWLAGGVAAAVCVHIPLLPVYLSQGAHPLALIASTVELFIACAAAVALTQHLPEPEPELKPRRPRSLY